VALLFAIPVPVYTRLYYDASDEMFPLNTPTGRTERKSEEVISNGAAWSWPCDNLAAAGQRVGTMSSFEGQLGRGHDVTKRSSYDQRT